MLEVKETSNAKHLLQGKTAVGLTPTPLSVVGGPMVRGILVRCPGTGEADANSDIVLVGNAQLTLDNGFPLVPGSALECPVDNVRDVYVMSTSTGQTVNWLGV